LRKVIAETMQQRRNIQTNENCILPVDSAAQGMFIIAKHCLQPGDEAIIFDPVDFLFKTAVEAAGATAILFPIDVTTGRYDAAQLRSLITPKTKLLCICNPLNPIGKVFTKDELTELGNIALENNLKIMSDEIWSDIIFPPNVYTSIASVSKALAAITYTVYGFSKSFGLAGLRVGFIIAPNEKEKEALLNTSQMQTTAYGVSTLSQIAAEAAYKHCWYWLEEFVAHLHKMRNLVVDSLNDMKGIDCHSPQGCYVVFPNITATGMDSIALTEYILKEAKVAVVPGAAKWFGPGAEGHIRLCFSTSETILQEALGRMSVALNKL
jgi:aminotransferase